MNQKVDTVVYPEGPLEMLSRMEVNRLRDSSKKHLCEAFRRCSFAVLNCGNEDIYGQSLEDEFKDFSISAEQEERGVKLVIKNAPADAFVEGAIIQGIKEHLFTVLRDICYLDNEIENNKNIDLKTSDGITNAVFHILRNGQVLSPHNKLRLVVCWGGHSISRGEYEYTKLVGYEMGLRGLNICTGCGPGAMKGPMKGATIGHAKQRIGTGRYIGLTEPGIIAAESPNPIVNQLVILPDIEKRLEAFVRIGHGVVVFPGGVGTMEEILYMLGILMNSANSDVPYPFVLTGRKKAEAYFKQIDQFIGETLGEEAQSKYKIIIDDPAAVAREMKQGIKQVREYRSRKQDSYFFNWSLSIDMELQQPFEPTHKNMAKLKIDRSLPSHELAANLRRAFSGIVSGNIKEDARNAIKKHGPFKIKGDKKIMRSLDALLMAFIEQRRMAIMADSYVPCYRVEE